MNSITLSQIQQDPVDFVRRVEAGESIMIVLGDQPLAEVKPIPAVACTERPYGLSVGEFMVPEDFDDPLPEEIVREFEGT